MKEFLHLMGGLWLEQPSAFSHRLSVLDSSFVARSTLKPKTYHLIPISELSAVGNQRSEMSRQTPVIGKLIPKTQYLIPILFLVFVSCSAALAQEPVGHTAPAAQAESISGIVVSAETGEPLEGATIRIKNTNNTTITNGKGEFTLIPESMGGEIEVSFLGYLTKEASFTNNTQTIFISLEEDQSILEEVIVSTGYQEIPKERATGSFVFIDNELLNRSVGLNILDRLEGVTSSLIFHKTPNQIGENNSNISIRGRSTIFGNTEPLIVLDNFPYDGDVRNINPQDVENITILKDAAAASIWGTRAGNGVIVITTKKGKYYNKPELHFNSNVSIAAAPDLFYRPQLSSAEFIQFEKFLFEKGRYNTVIKNGYSEISPAVNIMLMNRDNGLTDEEMRIKLDSLGRFDVRNDIKRNFYRKSLNQQYQFNIQGGSDIQRYFVSAGMDKNLANTVNDEYQRLTINAKNTYKLNRKLQLNTSLLFAQSKSRTNTRNYLMPNYPYEKLMDDQGNPLVVSDGNLRLAYVDKINDGFLDWHYRPLDENYQNSEGLLTDYRFNTQIKYNLTENLNLSFDYLFQKGNREGGTLDKSDSYYVRNLINTITHIDPITNQVIRPLPQGAINNRYNSSSKINNGRIALDYSNVFSEVHFLNILLGAEAREYTSTIGNTTLYGYDPETMSNQNGIINFNDDYDIYYSNGTMKIPNGTGNSSSMDRNLSYYLSTSYFYKDRYSLSASARRDESNLFGVKANQKGVPLWSLGALWVLSKEKFYNVTWLPDLKLRTTYGYNGNVDKSVTAYLTSRKLGLTNSFGSPYMYITNPPNPSLRWEKIKNFNIGAELGFIKNKFNLSVEYYIKNGIDLIGNAPVAPQVGIELFRGNFANLKTNGWDVTANATPIDKTVKWETFLNLNLVRDKITNYEATQGSNYDIITGNFLNPLVGYPYNSVFAFHWKGLDELGNPISSLNYETSKDYTAIINSRAIDDVVYIGSKTPETFGGFRNSFSWKNLEFSFNLNYKFGYYFRRPSLNNSTLINGGYRQADYDLRWQKAGDENITDVPSIVYPNNSSRNSVFLFSETLIEKGDHIRLQDLRFSYLMSNSNNKVTPFKSLRIYTYISNIGVLWRTNKKGIDPDYVNGIPDPMNYSFGINLIF
jgi:TonB-linked SusC/RagA family outer membrane protein